MKGHVDLLLLATLRQGPLHGYAIVEQLRDQSEGAFDLAEGTVYPALYRLERAGLLSSTWSDLPGPAQRYWHGSGNGRYFTYYNSSDGSTLFAGSGFLGCQDPSIWLWVGAGGGACSYHVDNYDVRYSAGPSTSLLSESATADALLIFVR